MLRVGAAALALTLVMPLATAEMVVVPLGIPAEVPYGYRFTRQLQEATGTWINRAGAVAQDQEDLEACAIPKALPGGPCPPQEICTLGEERLRLQLTNRDPANGVLTLRSDDAGGSGMVSAEARGFGGIAELIVTQSSSCWRIWVVGTYVPHMRAPYTLWIQALLT